MGSPHLRVFRDDNSRGDVPDRAILLSSYNSGATDGRHLATAGYSYDFVAKLFAPMLERLGKLVEVRNPKTQLSAAADRVRREGLMPVHVAFRPFQDADLCPAVENVVVPAWEFPDVPNASFDGNPQNDWVATANRCSLVLVGGPFTAKALDDAGVKTPVRIVPVPTPEPYFETPAWQIGEQAVLDCSAYVLPQPSVAGCANHSLPTRAASSPPWRQSIRLQGLNVYRHVLRPCLPDRLEPIVAASLRAGLAAWRTQSCPYRRIRGLELGGVVYTAIFNPDDGRKNWEDMITAFLQALGDRDDATLVLKLIARNQHAVNRVLAFYHRLDLSHRCRVVLIPDFLNEAEMRELARVSTFYLTSTRAEGNCLPLMNFLAAGRPAISPSHTAIADYFDSDVGFIVESHPEPCAWPHDSRLRWRTTWHRLVWPSLVEQIRRGYELAKNDQAAYNEMAQAARDKMRQWCHPDAVWPHLRSAMDLLVSNRQAPSAAAADDYGPPRIASDEPPILRYRPQPAESRSPAAFGNRFIQRPGTARTRIVVSLLSFRPGKIGGTETYLRKLIARLPHLDPDHDITLLMDRELAAENLFPGMRRAVIDMTARQVLRARGLEAVSPYRARTVERAIEQLNPDIVFFPQQSIFPKNVAAPCVLVVHDLYHLFLPQYLSRPQRLFRQRNYAYSISRADRIIAISQFTKRTVVDHYGVDAGSVTVVPHGWESTACDCVEPDDDVTGKYLYYPAITRPHKNHHVLFDTIAALKSQGRFDHQVVLSGIQTPHWKALCQQISRLGLQQTVRHVGYVPYQRVRQLYRGADCVVFPTVFEGFGLPVVEACEAGKKIIVSQLEVFDEIGVPKRFQIDFADPEQLHRALGEPDVTVLENRPWTWDESAAATMDVLDAAAGRRSAARPLAKAA